MNINKKLFLTPLLTSLFITNIYAQADNTDWKTLVHQYNQTELEKFDSEDNLTAFKNYLTLHPENALAEIYTGSSYCFIGRDVWMPWNKIDAVNTCIDKMEAAYINVQKQYPEDSDERLSADLIFGITTGKLPERFAQEQTSLNILTHAQNHPAFKSLEEKRKTQVINLLDTMSK